MTKTDGRREEKGYQVHFFLCALKFCCLRFEARGSEQGNVTTRYYLITVRCMRFSVDHSCPQKKEESLGTNTKKGSPMSMHEIYN